MSKLPHIGTTIFTVMSQMANEYQAVNLSQGFPNFPVDAQLKAIVSKCAAGELHQYMPMSGYPPLLAKIAGLTQETYQRTVVSANEILITAGATEGIFASIQALVDKDQEVIILDPAYDCYEAPVLLCHAKPVHIALQEDFTPDWNAIGNAMSHKTKMIIINNPHNPTGKMWTEQDYIQLEKLLDQYPGVLVLSDEVYEYITFEKPHLSVHQRPKLHGKSIIVSSFGKSFHITGWKIGYLIAPEPLMQTIKKVHQFLVFSVNSIAQHAINEYIEVVDVKALSPFYQQKRDFFQDLMRETRFELLPCEGSYFQLASYSGISEENDLDFTRRLVVDFGVATIPLSPFYANHKQVSCVRFCFAKDDETLIRAAERLLKL